MGKINWKWGVRHHWWQLGLIGSGMVLLLFGMSQAKLQTKGDPAVVIEVIPSPSPMNPKQIVADLAGAVEQPGVYRIDQGSRIEQLLILAGGLSAEADRSWVARFLNQPSLAILVP